jgi:uncharacterized membrane protein (DUF106 family)
MEKRSEIGIAIISCSVGSVIAMLTAMIVLFTHLDNKMEKSMTESRAEFSTAIRHQDDKLIMVIRELRDEIKDSKKD